MQKDNEKTLGSWEGFINKPTEQLSGGKGSKEKQQSKEGVHSSQDFSLSPPVQLLLDPSVREAVPFGYLLPSLGPWGSTSSGFNPLEKFLRSRGPQPALPLQYSLIRRGWRAR